MQARRVYFLRLFKPDAGSKPCPKADYSDPLHPRLKKTGCHFPFFAVKMRFPLDFSAE
jgi:hypothetical protein